MKEDAKTNEKTAEKLGQMVAMGDDAQAAAAAGCIYNQARASYLVDKKLGRTIDDAMPDKLAKASVILDNLERGNISPRDAYSKLTEIFDEQDLAPRKIETKSEQPTQKQANNGGGKSLTKNKELLRNARTLSCALSMTIQTRNCITSRVVGLWRPRTYTATAKRNTVSRQTLKT